MNALKKKSLTKSLTLIVMLVLLCNLFTAIPVSAADRGAWAPNTAYAVSDTVTYSGSTYTCRQAHTSLVGWEPSNVPALWEQGGSGTTPTPTPTTPTAPTTNGVTFYADKSYGGTAVTLDVGTYTMTQLKAAGIPNDWMSSLRVPSGYMVEVYQNDNFTGTKWTYTADSSWVGTDVNDQMTSVKVLAAVFYADIDYGGTAVALQPGSYTMAQLNAKGIPNDWMSSLKIPSGWTVEVYQNDNFTGTKWTFNASSSWVDTAVNDQMSSVKIYTGSPARLSFGVLSDIHLNGSTTIQQEETNLTKALIKFKADNIKVLMIAGDMANAGETAAYQKFNTIFNSVFTDPLTAPQKVFVMGNHDYWNGMSVRDAQSNFTNTLGCTMNTNISVDGYHFIGLSTEAGDTNGVFTSKSTEWLKTQLDAAVAENPSNPIFVTFHQPVLNTVYLSDEWGNATLDSILKNYPQVVTFAGHSHAVLEDERSIYQLNYTCVGTSTLTYTELESGKANGTIPPRASEVAQGIIGTISNTAVTLQRYDFHNDCQIKSNWVLNRPLSKNTFVYTSARADTSAAPYFEAGSKVTTSNITNVSATLTFTQAKDVDFVHSYRIQVYDTATNAIVKDFPIFSDFYLGLQRMASTLSYSVGGLNADTNYGVHIYGIESFGKQSQPITTTFTTLPEQPSVDVLNVNFTDGTAKDNSSYNTSYKLKNNAQVQLDSTLNKNVLVLDGTNYANYYVSDAQLNLISNQFTLETVFKMNTIQNQAIVENCQNSGIGFESTSNGLVELWAYIGGSYKHVGVQLQSGIYYHLVATYDGSNLNLYLNGQLVDSSAASGTISHTSGVAMCLGGDPDTTGNATLLLNGNIALTRIMNKAISAADVQSLYTKFLN